MESKLKFLQIYDDNGLITTNQDNSYTVNFVSGGGTGSMRCYNVFDGIILSYNEFDMYDCVCAEQQKIDGAIEINHCKSGRYECQFTNGEYGYITEGDLAVNLLNNTIRMSSFPLEYYKGLSVIIDIENAQKSIDKAAPCIKIDLAQIKDRLCEKNECFIARATDTIEHVFSELYCIPNEIKSSYMKIKIIELLVFLTVVDIGDKDHCSSYFPKHKVNKIKCIREKLTDNLDERYTIEQLAGEFGISPTSLKNCFKHVFGCSIYSYIRNYRIKKAAYYLTKTDYTITEISSLLGYTNSSKFSAAFKDIMKITPSQYKKKLLKEK